MNKQYNDIELISTHSSTYVANNRRYKNISDNMRKYKNVDPFSADYNKALRKWESVVQRLLSKITCEEERRILKYSEEKFGYRYREIDFIAQPSTDRLVFCELKLKENFKIKLGSKVSGWAQLNKSLSIASQKYNNLNGLSICVDMSHIYGLESAAHAQDYCNFLDIQSYLSSEPIDKNTIWLSSLEIAKLAIEYGLLTHDDVDIMKKLYQEQKDPLSVLNNQDSYITNNPFEVLGFLSSTKTSYGI